MPPFYYQNLNQPDEEGQLQDGTHMSWCDDRSFTERRWRWQIFRPVLSALLGVSLLYAVPLLRRSEHVPTTLSKTASDSTAVKGVTKDFSIFQLSMSTYEKIFGDTDPFQFKCPVPGVLAEGSGTTSCCGGYNALGWPFQFLECEHLGYCTTCWVESSEAQMRRHPGIHFAGASWAATISVMNGQAQGIRSEWAGNVLKAAVQNSPSLGPTVENSHVGNHQMHVKIRTGLLEGRTNVCLAIDDWDVDMLNEDRENIHARVFKSSRRKLAIVAFRGTQFESAKNWHVDADIQRIPMTLPNGNITLVHEGFLTALDHILPHVKRWVDGYILGLFHAVPSDWKLIFTGHSLGGALALLAATKAFAEHWPRKPEAVIGFGVPRVADKALDDWWQQQALCDKLIRINTYNDLVHVMPFHKMWNAFSAVSDVYDCVVSPLSCISQSGNIIGSAPDPSEMEISNQWAHVCPQSEVLIPSRVKGINEELEELSPFGGVLAHLNENCLYGYIYAVLHSNITTLDDYCGL
ncbi:unnamed protein product [Cladocopium goreaui]|uniref:Lipase n=1 Tax=Cladocopium goreaui TaxID=2562237 RepID=A0A9P1CLP3_9DINO|nr:unnamed protein product [Cladocopium goreaui]